MILAGDIAGTHTHLDFFTRAGERLTSGSEETFPSRAYSGLAGIVSQYLSTPRRSAVHPCDMGPYAVVQPFVTQLCSLLSRRVL